MTCVKVSRLISTFAIAVAVLMCSGLALGAEKTLTLTQSIPQAISQSPQVRLAEIALIEAEKNLERVSLVPGNRKGVQSATDQVALAKMSLAAAKDDVAAGVEQAYFSVLMSNDIVAMRSTAYNNAKSQLEAGKAKLRAGLARQVDVNALNDNLIATQYSLTAAKYSQRISLLKFNKAMGWNLETKVSLSDKLDFKPVKVELASSLSLAQTQRRDVIQARYNVQRKTEDLDLAKNEFTPVAEQEQLSLDLEKAQIALTQVTKDAQISVEEAYTNLVNVQNEIDNKVRNLARNKQAMLDTEKKYKAGLARASDFISAQSQYENAELQRLQTINDYRSALSSFYRSIGQSHPALLQK